VTFVSAVVTLILCFCGKVNLPHWQPRSNASASSSENSASDDGTDGNTNQITSTKSNEKKNDHDPSTRVSSKIDLSENREDDSELASERGRESFSTLTNLDIAISKSGLKVGNAGLEEIGQQLEDNVENEDGYSFVTLEVACGGVNDIMSKGGVNVDDLNARNNIYV
jgi:hypothetical protein